MQLEVAFIGSGNIAWHLSQAMDNAGHTIAQVISKTEVHAKSLAGKFGAHFSDDISKLYGNVDVCFICVADNQIEHVLQHMPNVKSILVHTCGPKPMNILGNKSAQIGVFYPLQSFSKNQAQRMLDVPILLESSGNEAYTKLYALADSISNKVIDVSSDDRLRYHLAAVFANNFTNHMVFEAATYLEKNKLDFKVLYPIIVETARKIITAGPAASQTGPAKRGDSVTMQKHMALLADNERLSDLYSLISDAIRQQQGA